MYKDYNTSTTNATGINAIKNSIRNILCTPRGTVPGKPRFGSALYRVIFQPLDPLSEAMAKKYIEEALTEFEDRIVIKDITLVREDAYNRLIITVSFTYKDYDYTTNETGVIAISVDV